MHRSWIAILLAVPAAVLGYGYWFGVTHGALSVSVLDSSDAQHSVELTPVELSFLDAAGRTLAEARGGPPYATIVLVSPATYACHEPEVRAPFSVEAKERWTECFARQSRWLTTWIRHARAVDLRAGSCTLRRLPIVVSEHPDTWWLWWMPLRHIGGKPYTSFTVQIHVDRKTACEI